MSYLEELKAQIHQRVEVETSTAVLEHIQQFLSPKVPLMSPELEDRLAAGFADVEAGRTMSLEEFIERDRIDAEVRARKFGA